MQTIDFNRSFIRWRVDSLLHPAVTVTHVPPTTLNNVRISLECRCQLIERLTGRSHTYVLGASCKTERVGATQECWLLPNADFCLIASEQEFLILKSFARNAMEFERSPGAIAIPQERQSGDCRSVFAGFHLHYRPMRGRALPALDDIIEAIRGDRHIVSRTEYSVGDYHVILEHPVKTINYSEREQVFQTDTGPILLPDLSAERLASCTRLVECFDLAYSAFNSMNWAEFIVNVPTPVGEAITVNHYSRPSRIEPVVNSLIEVQEEIRVHGHGVAGDRKIRTDGAETTVRSAVTGS